MSGSLCGGCRGSYGAHEPDCRVGAAEAALAAAPRMKPVTNADGSPYGVSWDCPGCRESHVVPTHGPNAWTFNGDLVRPTLSPSILIFPSPPCRDGSGDIVKTIRCHCFIRDGRIEFCSDSEHRLAGQTAEMAPVKEMA